MRFLLAPHTVTPWNLFGRYQGHIDIALGPEGREQAEKLAKMLTGVARIVSSDLKRALQTAEIVNERLSVTLTTDTRLRECHGGALQGLTREEALELFGDPVLPHWDDRGMLYDFRPYGGEHRDAVAFRMKEVLEEYRVKFAREDILVVSHGRALDTLLIELGHEPGIVRGTFREISLHHTPHSRYPLG